MRPLDPPAATSENLSRLVNLDFLQTAKQDLFDTTANGKTRDRTKLQFGMRLLIEKAFKNNLKQGESPC